MGELGFSELIVIALIAVLIFGPKKLPELGGGLGKAIREFKSAFKDTGTSPNEPEQQADLVAKATSSPKRGSE